MILGHLLIIADNCRQTNDTDTRRWTSFGRGQARMGDRIIRRQWERALLTADDANRASLISPSFPTLSQQHCSQTCNIKDHASHRLQYVVTDEEALSVWQQRQEGYLVPQSVGRVLWYRPWESGIAGECCMTQDERSHAPRCRSPLIGHSHTQFSCGVRALFPIKHP